MKVNYVVEQLSVIPRTTSILIHLKRLPTKEELAQSKAEMDRKPDLPLSFPDFILAQMHQESSFASEPELDFKHVKIKVLLSEFENSNMNVGKVVQLDIPSNISDILTDVRQEGQNLYS